MMTVTAFMVLDGTDFMDSQLFTVSSKHIQFLFLVSFPFLVFILCFHVVD